MDNINKEKLAALNSGKVIEIVHRYENLCKPENVVVLTDSQEDRQFIRQASLNSHEEFALATAGHTLHFDGPEDQGRDKEKTKVLPGQGRTLSKHINTGDRAECLNEMNALLENSMRGKTMYVAFYCLGPMGSIFSQACMQISDSAYVIHSANLLYRGGYENFKNLPGEKHFFHFVHSAGELTAGISKHPDKKRIYIDIPGNRVFSVNVQYAGNSVGLKKLALRLSINKASKEDWLCEHMFIMGVHSRLASGPVYFAGAFPSASGKTTTAMTPGHTIIADDISYFRNSDGQMRGVNAEQGIFGIIESVSEKNDPVIYKTLTTPRELIFSNVLVSDHKPYWLDMGIETPKKGNNFMGEWQAGMTDNEGRVVPLAHKNARYTLKLQELENLDPNWDDHRGVPISAVLYGGRDPDTLPVIVEAFDWPHGVMMGASIESETTAATLGKMGQKKHDPMANVDFLSIPLGEYLNNHLDFGELLKPPPKIFSVNYFLKENDVLIGKKLDTKVWLAWMAGRVSGKFNANKTPIGYTPLYEDLKALFKELLAEEYFKSQCDKQFTIRTKLLIDRLKRVEHFYASEANIPEELYKQLTDQIKRLEAA